jgi:hypothetical protein
VNIEALIEELEEMGRSEQRELRNRLSVLLAHLLKWQYQPERRSRSWEATLEVQRSDIQSLLKDNPSLRPRLSELGEEAYFRGVRLAIGETNLEKSTFPLAFADTGWSWEQVLDMEYLPQ